jgi:O-methyltransferase
MLAHSLRHFSVLLVRSPLHRWTTLPAAALLPAAYAVKYAAWFHENDVHRRLVPTPTPFGYENRYALYETLVDELSLSHEPLRYLEFGVASGASLSWWVGHNHHADSRFVGFDTFEGLPEDWGRIPQGAFSTHGQVPEIDDARCSYRCGLFHETLPRFLLEAPTSSSRTILHLDADLYGPTLFVLVTMAPRLRPGDLLIFDEFADVMNEFRALQDLGRSFPLKLRLLRAVNWGNKVVFEVQ